MFSVINYRFMPVDFCCISKTEKMKKIIMLALLVASTTTMFAQSNLKSDSTQIKKKAAKAQYTCPTHPWVKSKTPGTCSICGTHLIVNRVSSKQGQLVTYSCPMHPDVVSDKPGKCSKCGMTMEEHKDSIDLK